MAGAEVCRSWILGMEREFALGQLDAAPCGLLALFNPTE